MKNEPLHIERYIKLITKDELEKDDVKAWFRCVKKHAPPGIIRSINIVTKRGKPKSVGLVHRTDEQDSHSYLIPLVRDLTETETESIAKEFAEDRPKLDFDIETHETKLLAKDNAGISLTAANHLMLCNALAKHKHEDWMRERTTGGWRYGTGFDADEKIHPLLLPWDQLPDRYREPDMEWPNKLVNVLNDQGYAILPKIELEHLLNLLRNVV